MNTPVEKIAFIAAAAKAIKGGLSIAGSALKGSGKVGSGLLRPITTGYKGAFKSSPIMTTVTGAMGIGAVKDALGTMTKRPFTQSLNNLKSYNNMKLNMPKYGEVMDKEAGVLDTFKKVTNYGGTPASIIGLAAMASVPFAANALLQPSLTTAGTNLQRNLFPVADRIKADEEMAKKELGIAAAGRMDDYMSQQKSQGRTAVDTPVLARNLERFAGNDPIISDYVNADPANYGALQNTLNSVYSFAPDIATNQHAAQSILREVAMSPDGGLNYNTIKLIADAQKSISQSRG